MVSKTDPRKKRMHELRQRGNKTAEPKFPSFAQLASEFCQPDHLSKKVDFAEALNSPGKISKEELWNGLAREALTLGDEDRDIRRAFDFFKLDPKNPFSWRLLIEYFSYVEFFEKPKGTAGAKPKWTPQSLLQLESEIKERKLEKVRADKLGPKLSKDKSSKFYRRGSEALRQKIGLMRQYRASVKED
jgi:hypothetical protein